MEVSKRFPSVSALRAALFDLWRTTHFESLPGDDGSLLDAVLANPDSVDAWRKLVPTLESSESRDAALRGINADLIMRLSAIDEHLFGRVIHLLCDWAAGTSFDFDYCDVVGDRLLEAYRLASVRIRCEIVLASLELSVSHNRWHVMDHVGAMLSPTADNGLVDRILIEMNLEERIEENIRCVEEIIHWRRDRWHEKIARFLNRKDADA
jgi:hypothetical protein